MRNAIAIMLLAVFLNGCATTPPIEPAGAELRLEPREVAGDAERFQGTDVLWSGVIVASRNLEEHTQLEVLAYPTGDDQEPDLGRSPRGRFLVEQPGFIETVNYAPGRAITVRGEVTGEREGRIGEARYTYPVLRAQKLHLWPEQQRGSTRPRFNLGVGVIFGR